MKQGIWVPEVILQDSRLSPIEKLIGSLIISLDRGEEGCWASNQYLARMCLCSVTTVSTAISKLIKLGYIRRERFDGRRRYLKSCLSDFERLSYRNRDAALAKTETDNIKDMKAYKKADNIRKIRSGGFFDAMERPAPSHEELMKELAGRNGNLI